MHAVCKSNEIFQLGIDDKDIDLFEGQYPVPNGISYNSYLILDAKIAVLDTVDARAASPWLTQLYDALDGRAPDYLIVSHVEPDHAGCVSQLTERFPEMTLVGTAKALDMLANFCVTPVSNPTLAVKEGDTLCLGGHTLQFIQAPMVHWPEVMVTYEQQEKLLFSADAFGKFGALDTDEPWTDEARRYYINIVGKYGMQVQKLLQKAAALEITAICPLHGPVLSGDLTPYIEKYQLWSSYTPEESGVLVAYASIHGNTAGAAQLLGEQLQLLGEKVVLLDLARCDIADAVQQAFRFDRMVLAASSYDGGVFLPMEEFLLHLQAKAFQNRTAAIVENGSWAPCAAKKMQTYLEGMKNITILEQMVSIRSVVKPADADALAALAAAVHQAAQTAG